MGVQHNDRLVQILKFVICLSYREFYLVSVSQIMNTYGEL